MKRLLCFAIAVAISFAASAADSSSPFDSGVKPCWRLGESNRGARLPLENAIAVDQTDAIADHNAFTFAATFMNLFRNGSISPPGIITIGNPPRTRLSPGRFTTVLTIVSI